MCDEAEGCCSGTPFAGNFRGVCPLNRAKGVHHTVCGTRRGYGGSVLFRNLSAPDADGTDKLRIFQKSHETHGTVLW